MDMYGIGNALNAVMQVYFRGSVRTGRTTLLIENLKSGDRVLFKSGMDNEHRATAEIVLTAPHFGMDF